MANSATLSATLPISLGKGDVSAVYMYVVVYDTTGNDLTIRTPASDKFIGVAGMMLADTTATNITFKCGSVNLLTLELAASGQIIVPIGNHLMVPGNAKGDAMKINCSGAFTRGLFYMVEFTQFNFS